MKTYYVSNRGWIEGVAYVYENKKLEKLIVRTFGYNTVTEAVGSPRGEHANVAKILKLKEKE